VDNALQVVVEMTEFIWQRFRKDLEDISQEEVDWRPLPEANSINLIVRHLAIEAEWHRAGLERGEPMPQEATEDLLRHIDRVPVDFEQNLATLENAYAAFLTALRGTSLTGLQLRTEAAYGQSSVPAHFLGFHQAIHLSRHWGQICTIRNLYRKTRGEPARFFPENPTFPR
jgi:hypothetical protein